MLLLLLLVPISCYCLFCCLAHQCSSNCSPLFLKVGFGQNKLVLVLFIYCLFIYLFVCVFFFFQNCIVMVYALFSVSVAYPMFFFFVLILAIIFELIDVLENYQMSCSCIISIVHVYGDFKKFKHILQ